MGLVCRMHVKISEASSPVVAAVLTDLGRRTAEALRDGRGVEEPAGQEGGAKVTAGTPDQGISALTGAGAERPAPLVYRSLFGPGPAVHDGRRAVRG